MTDVDLNKTTGISLDENEIVQLRRFLTLVMRPDVQRSLQNIDAGNRNIASQQLMRDDLLLLEENSVGTFVMRRVLQNPEFFVKAHAQVIRRLSYAARQNWHGKVEAWVWLIPKDELLDKCDRLQLISIDETIAQHFRQHKS